MEAWLLVIVGVVFIGAVQGQRAEWTSEMYPNPMVNQTACNRPPKRDSYVCDPNRIIKPEQARVLDYILTGVGNYTTCPCSQWACDRPNHNNGYFIAVALVRKLKRSEGFPDTEDGRKGLARIFAYNLLKKEWRYGQCDEGVIIVYSQKDGILMTLAGSTARMRLTEPVIYHFSKKLSKFFREDGNVGQGLHYLVMNYRRVLDGEYYLPVSYKDANIDGAAATYVSWILLSVSLLFGFHQLV